MLVRVRHIAKDRRTRASGQRIHVARITLRPWIKREVKRIDEHMGDAQRLEAATQFVLRLCVMICDVGAMAEFSPQIGLVTVKAQWIAVEDHLSFCGELGVDEPHRAVGRETVADELVLGHHPESNRRLLRQQTLTDHE